MKQLVLVFGLLCATALHPTIAAELPAAATPATSAPATPGTAAAAPAGSASAGSAAPAPAVSSPVKDAPSASPAPTASTGPIRVQVVTSLGNFTIELLQERAPLTVAQFLKYVDQGYYAGTIFHRVIANFVIQGGGFDTNYNLKGSPAKVVNESGNGLTNQRGTVGLARAAEPHSGDVQFFVNLFDNAALDPNQTRWGYAVFGKIVQGMEIVDRIGNVATGAKGPFKEDAPLQQVVIERIERVTTP
jgi:peptidyl-prolyl cis-trans isomerase A (cyclophilin A)/peptidyl-prolyl cis-trans isomerase B (cyclophilin B)